MSKALRLTAPLPSELQEQITVVEWWRWWAPTKGIDSRLLCANVNGSYLNGDAIARARQMAKLKASGLVVGWPDLQLALPHAVFHGMYIELKRRDGRPTPEQLEMITLLRRQAYNAIIARGADEAIHAIKAYVGER